MDWIDIWYFFQGNLRTHAYYDDKSSLKTHIVEQFEWRLTKMNKQCWETGQCVCECKVPNLQMADKSCDENCYPKMMNENEWMEFKALGADSK